MRPERYDILWGLAILTPVLVLFSLAGLEWAAYALGAVGSVLLVSILIASVATKSLRRGIVEGIVWPIGTLGRFLF